VLIQAEVIVFRYFVKLQKRCMQTDESVVDSEAEK
jgi:hypothetical protein